MSPEPSTPLSETEKTSDLVRFSSAEMTEQLRAGAEIIAEYSEFHMTDPNAKPLLDRTTLPLERIHRDAMLVLILEWAKIDGALGLFLSLLHDFTPEDGALLIRGMKAAQIFKDARKVVRDKPSGQEYARKLGKMKKLYEYYAPFRNRIAHSTCLGVDIDNKNLILFISFAADNHGLIAEEISLDQINDAIDFARKLNLCLNEASSLLLPK